MKNYIVLDGMIDNQKNVLYAAFDKGYKQGVQDGKEEVWNARYLKGLNDAWDAAREICTNWVLSDKALSDIFGEGKTIDDIMRDYSASEAIARIKEYEEKRMEEMQEEDEDIKVGDEIKCGNRLCVVTRVGDGYMTVVYDNGDGGVLAKEKCQKTGRHFPKIAEALKQMQEGEE